MSEQCQHPNTEHCMKCGSPQRIGGDAPESAGEENRIESEGLNYFVIAVRGGQWLAGFQYRQSAEEWRHWHCRTGLVVTRPEWMEMQMQVIREEQEIEAMKPYPNGGIIDEHSWEGKGEA